MIIQYRLSEFVPSMSSAIIECIHVSASDLVRPGSKFLDLSVDLTSAFAQECPPISFFRVIIRESAWLRKLDAIPGQRHEIASVVAIFSTTENEDLDQPVTRDIRTSTAGILHHQGMWTGSQL
jgi:hypothetical protein